jgi:hypothetical protein
MAQNPQIFGAGVQGRSPVVTAVRRVNAYVEVERHPDRSQVTFYGLPGIAPFVNLGETPVRGMFSLGAFLYIVHRDELRKVRNDKVSVLLGTLDTDQGRAYFTANNVGEILIVDGVSGYVYDTMAEAFAKITDVDFPANPRTCTTINGYGVINYGTQGQFAISAPDDFSSWDALDFSTADAHPDELLAVTQHQGMVAMLGVQSMEYWGYTGAADFPLARVFGSQHGWGLAAPASVVALGTGSMALLRQNLGQGGPGPVQVGYLAGGAPEIVSDPDLEHVLNRYAVVDDAVGAAFSLAGHPMYQLSFPAAERTWVFDQRSGVWSERQSLGQERHRGVTGAWHNGAMYWGDAEDGQVWRQDPDLWTEGQDDQGNDVPVAFVLRSHHLSLPNNQRFTLPYVQIDMAEGEGTATGQGQAPQALLRISRDKGRSFGVELSASIGGGGKYGTRVRFTRCGQYRDAVLELRITDPVSRVVTGEALRMKPGRLG